MKQPTVTLYNNRQIFAPGTGLADVPCEFQGVPWAVYVRQNEIEAQERWTQAHTGPAPLKAQPIQTARDRYGWRALGQHSAPLLKG